MGQKIDLGSVYKPSENVVARDVHGEFIIIPITSDVGDGGDDIFSLNKTGRAIWNTLDGKKTLAKVAMALAKDFTGSPKEIEKDVLGLAEELLKRRMITAA